jgi:hypothetical protein
MKPQRYGERLKEMTHEIVALADDPQFLRKMMRSSDVPALDSFASSVASAGANMVAMSYLAAFRIHELYEKVEGMPDKVLLRCLRMWNFVDAPVPSGSTGLRRYFCERVFGWPSYMSWAEDWEGASRSSVWHKIHDIQGWRNAGASWETILKLLAHVPMAGRDVLTKPVKQEALPPGGKAEYLEELTALPPGQARKKVSEDAGEMQVWLADVQWHQGHLLLKIILEDSGGYVSYDILCSQTSNNPSWMAVAYWMTERLGRRLMIS